MEERPRPLAFKIPDAGQAPRTGCSIPPEHRVAARRRASRQAALDGRSDELWRKECERDRHVDLADAALLARRNLLTSVTVPETISSSQRLPARDGACQSARRFRFSGRTSFAVEPRAADEDFPRRPRRRLLPWNSQDATVASAFGVVCHADSSPFAPASGGQSAARCSRQCERSCSSRNLRSPTRSAPDRMASPLWHPRCSSRALNTMSSMLSG